jgi:hypothetical protein
MRIRVLATTLIGLAAAAMFGLSADAQSPQKPPSQKPAPQCFFSIDWQGWKATPDSKAIYIRVGVNKIYRLDLSSACPELQMPDAHLITHIRGSDLICSPLDIDLRVSDMHGFATPCIVTAITPLSDAEAAALPSKLKP